MALFVACASTVGFLLPPVLPPMQHVEVALLSTSLMPLPAVAAPIDAAINGANGQASTVAAMLATGTCGIMLSMIMSIALDSPKRNAGYVVPLQVAASQAEMDGCEVIDLPPFTMHGDTWYDEAGKAWWVCPDAELDQGNCREVYVNGERTIACAYD